MGGLNCLEMCGGASFFEEAAEFEDRGITGVCLGHNPLVSGGVTVGTIMDGLFNVIVTAKVRKLGERRPQRWKLHVHPTDPKRLHTCGMMEK